MVIKDAKGLYELKVDKARRLVYENAKGMFNAEDYTRMTDEYVNRIVPYLGKGDWAKVCDLREYKPSTSNSPEHMNAQVARVVGFVCAAVIMDSTTLKMQINRTVKGIGMEVGYFDDEKEADAWLKSKGF